MAAHSRVDRPRDANRATAGVTWESSRIFPLVYVAVVVLDSLQRVLDYSRRVSLPR